MWTCRDLKVGCRKVEASSQPYPVGFCVFFALAFMNAQLTRIFSFLSGKHITRYTASALQKRRIMSNN